MKLKSKADQQAIATQPDRGSFPQQGFNCSFPLLNTFQHLFPAVKGLQFLVGYGAGAAPLVPELTPKPLEMGLPR